MAKNIIKIIDSQDKVVSQTQITSGKSVTVPAKEGQSYEFISGATKRAPDEIKTTREGNNLKVEIKDGEEVSTTIIEDYYTNGEGDLVGLAEDGHYYNFVPEEMGNDYMVTDLADGVTSFQALGSEGDSMTPWWLGLPLLALGAAGGGGGSGAANTLDTTAPTQITTIQNIVDDDLTHHIQGEVENDGCFNDMTPTLSGTIDAPLGADETVFIYRNSEKIGEATMIDDTHWTFDDNLSYTENTEYIYTARAEDVAGNLGVESGKYTVILDTVAPHQSVYVTNVIDDVDPTTGDVPHKGSTDDSTPLVQGTISIPLDVATGEKVVVLCNGVEMGTATMIDDTHWEILDTKGFTLVQNGHIYTARVEDEAGNRGGISNSYRITFDDEAPTQTVSILKAEDDYGEHTYNLSQDGLITDDPYPTLRGVVSTVLAENEHIVIYQDGEYVGDATMLSNGTWKFDATLITWGGSYDFTAYVKDDAGHLSSVSNTFTVNRMSSWTLDSEPTTDNGYTIYDIRDDNLINNTDFRLVDADANSSQSEPLAEDTLVIGEDLDFTLTLGGIDTDGDGIMDHGITKGFEIYDINNNTLIINDLLSVQQSGSEYINALEGHALIINGNGGEVNLDDSWSTSTTQELNGVTYDVYHNSAVGNPNYDLLIEHDAIIVITG